ncbi:MAG: hypothetical protein NVSMB57_03000 [Actinomycetota bacterium]
MTIKTLTPREVEPLLDRMSADGLDVILDAGVWMGFLEDAHIAGVVHVLRFDEHVVLDDVWTEPASRRQGVASALIDAAREQYPRLWLICDEPDIGFYERRGFRSMRDLPEPIAAHYASKNEWPRADDHAHYAMVCPAPTAV